MAKNSFVFLFLFLQFIAFVLLVKNNNYQNSKFFNSSNFLIGNLYASVNNINDYFNLKEVNTQLAEENAKLKAQSISSFTKIFGSTVEVNDTVYLQKYQYISARVINNSTNKRANYLTLDKGALNGIKADMGVISPNGVIGIVKNVSENFCSVISVLHEKNKVSAKIKNSEYFGSLTWELGDYRSAKLMHIPNHVKLHVGDTIVTSGYSSVYPEGILIGTIDEFELPEGNNFYEIKVKFTVDYQRLSHVFIVKYKQKEEQKKLEALTEEEHDH